MGQTYLIERSSYWIDPRTKLLLMLLVNVTIFGGRSLITMIPMALIPIYLLYKSGKKRPALKCLMIYSVALVANEWLVPCTTGFSNMVVVMIGGLFYRMLPGFVMGYYLVMTTTVSEFTAAMTKMNIPDEITIPMSVMFRFFPTIGEEALSISEAMKMRGISFNWQSLKKPILLLEYQMVPLLISTVSIGNDLTVAALTRGLGGTAKRTNICRVGFTNKDHFLIAVTVLAFASGFILK